MRNGSTSEAPGSAWLFMMGFYHRGMAYDEVLAGRVRASLAAETLDDTELDRWIARARSHVASLPPK